MKRQILAVRRCPDMSPHLLVCLSYLPDKEEYVTSIYNIETGSHAHGQYYCLPYGVTDKSLALKKSEEEARQNFEKRVAEYNAI